MFQQDLLQDIDVSNTVSNSLERAIIQYLADVPEVKEVYFSQKGDIVDIWTIVSEANRNVRKKVYLQELRIIKDVSDFIINFRVSGIEGASTPASAVYKKIDIEKVRRDAGSSSPS